MTSSITQLGTTLSTDFFLNKQFHLNKKVGKITQL